jgi:hypothetical protein
VGDDAGRWGKAEEMELGDVRLALVVEMLAAKAEGVGVGVGDGLWKLVTSLNQSPLVQSIETALAFTALCCVSTRTCIPCVAHYLRLAVMFHT